MEAATKMKPDNFVRDLAREISEELRDAQPKTVDFDSAQAYSRKMTDVTQYRLDQYEKRADAADARMQRVEDKLSQINEKLSGLATRATVWGAVATVVGAGLGLLGVIVAILTYLQAFPHP